jgi:Fibronectin type III domain/WD40-like Beta Propeller Repeat
MVFSGVSARAAITHEYLSQITEVPAGSGAPFTGPLSSSGIGGLTVDGAVLYLAEGARSDNEYRLDKFDASSGAFLAQFPQAPSSIGFLNQGVAVGHATGETEVYVSGDERGPPGTGTFESVGVVTVWDAAGNLQGVPWNGGDTPSTAFGCFGCGRPGDVAVDDASILGDWASGDVYVADPHGPVVDVFKPEAKGGEKYRTRLTGVSPAEPFIEPYKVAVSSFNGDVLVVDQRIDGSFQTPFVTVDVFKPSVLENEYEYVGALTGPAGPYENVTGIAADGSNGDIYVADGHGVDQYSAAGAFLGRITGAGTPAGGFTETGAVAVDPNPANHRVYVSDRTPNVDSWVDVFGPSLVIPDVTTGDASGIGVNSITLNGTVNPNEAGSVTCQFVWGVTSSFGQTVPCSEPVADGNSPVAVHAELTGLQPDTTYHYRLQASNAKGTNPGEAVQDHEVTTLGAGVHATSTSNVTSASVTFDATIDPNGSPTTFYVQFGTSTAYGQQAPTPPGSTVGSSKGDTEVSVHVHQGISPGTAYHYRVVAVSEIEVSPGVVETREFPGPDETFTAQTAAGGLTLPDGRQWEMVSPAEKMGAQILAIGQYSSEGAVIQAAAGGDALTYMTVSPVTANPEGYTNYNQVFSARGSGGWRSQDIGLYHDSATGASVGEGNEYRFFSEDLSFGVVQPFGAFIPSLSDEASEQTSYLRTIFANGDVNSPCVSSCYRPLVTSMVGHANVPAGTVFGEEGQCPPKLFCGPSFQGATPDLKHVVFTSLASLTATATGGERSLYEWSDGELALVSVLPGGGAAGGSPELGAGLDGSVRHAISDDGSRIVWSEFYGQKRLYIRDMAKGVTVQLDAAQGGSGEGAGVFQIASNDGSRVFFTDEQHLTANSGGQTNEPDLYECEMVVEAGELKCKLTDLTPVSFEKSFGGVRGVVGASNDGSWVYFVDGTTLYVDHEGTTKIVAILSGSDEPDWKFDGQHGVTARVSPDGRWLAFMSQRELTGYDSHDTATGKPDEEVYLYDAQANGGSGRILCASCNPTGARPDGTELGSNGLVEAGDRWYSLRQPLAANVPGWVPSGGGVFHQPRYLADDGRLFFDSSDGLVPQDVNGAEDVYQYEPIGVGDCATSSVSFSVRSDGCVGLVSSGGSGEESAFLDASATGGDAFFLTTAKLSGADRDTTLDIYDAHECTPGSPCFAVPSVQPPACDTGDSCKAAPSPQPGVFGAPSSATFSGAGNVTPESKPVVRSKGLSRAQKLARALKECRKRTGRRRAVCVRHARARFVKRGSLRVNASGKGGR